MHESWKTATREVLLEALEWQSALTKEYSAKYDKVCAENARWISFAQDIGITLGCEYGVTPQENKHLWEQIVALRDNRLDEAVKIGVCEVCKEKSVLECDRLRAELETKTKLCDASIKHLKAENATLSRDYKQCLEQYDKFLKKKLICRHCNLSFVAVNAVQVRGCVYCSEECALPYIKRLL